MKTTTTPPPIPPTPTNATDATNANTTNAKILSEVDRRLLNILCPAFSNKDLVEPSKEGTDQEPDKPESLEELSDSIGKKNHQTWEA
ncbi:hypothetical protein KI688_004591 [Linnemannia hyalina]|uniref:Uncharacterized protein n=1 Tax=Linnemannia hyalina TaxID=64524 RepID=A0A9P7XKZ1_9FUNG|nr:hypothetical protein KI688_004591 [Linnemannia hyalina]